MAGEPKRKRRVTELRVNEISLVDEPAVPKARFLIVKRDKGGGATMSQEFDRGFDCDDEGVVLDKAGDYGYSDERPRSPMEAAEKLVAMLMTMRRGLPSQIRRMVMELDLAMDEMTRGAEKQKEDEEEDAKKQKEEEDEEAKKQKEEEDEEAKKQKEEEEEEKKRGTTGYPRKQKEEEDEEAKKQKEEEDEEAKKQKEEEDEEAKKQKEEEDEKKRKQRKECPPGMVFDEDKGKCVPKGKKPGYTEKQKEKENEEGRGDRGKETGTYPAPRGIGKDKSQDVDLTGIEDLELSDEETSRVEKIIERLK